MTPPLSIVIAEDSFVVREGLRRLLDDGDDIDVVGAVGSAPELLDAVATLSPDVVVTDIRMPPGSGMDGITAAQRIRASSKQVGVVVLSQHADASYAQALFSAGTTGLAYLLKERVGHREDLVRAIHAVHSGGSVIDPAIVEVLLHSRQHQETSPLRHLSARELEVLAAMAEGLTNQAIAQRLFVSESAISKHVGTIFHKLGLEEGTGLDRRVSAALTFLSINSLPGAHTPVPPARHPTRSTHELR